MLRFFIILLSIISLTACRTNRQTVTDYVYINRADTITLLRWRVDSITLRDSVSTLIKGDTVVIDRWHTASRDRLRIDTVYKVSTDTVARLARTELTKVEYRQRWWQSALAWIGAAALAAFAGWLLIKLKLKK